MIRRIIASRDVLDEFRAIARDGYPNERIAFLYGRALKTKLEILQIWIPDSQDAYSWPDRICVPDLVQDIARSFTARHEMIGTIHSHPDPDRCLDLCRSEVDCDTGGLISFGPVEGICRVRPTKRGLTTKIRLWLAEPQPKVTVI